MQANEPKRHGGLTSLQLSSILDAMASARVALVGDICLDAYWKADLTLSELSRETPHYPLPVVEERYSPGAGGNVAANLAALKPRSVTVVSTIGRDWRGDLLLQALSALGVDTALVLRHPGRITDAYIKPYRRGISDVEYEDPRLDFANTDPLSEDAGRELIGRIHEVARSCDVLCVSDQFRFGCVTGAVREALRGLARQGLTVVVDSRSRIGEYSGCVLKPNGLEASMALGLDPKQSISTIAGATDVAVKLSELARSPVCMTLGEQGSLLAQSAEEPCWLPGAAVKPPFDVCGAGDTFLSAFSTALAAGAAMEDAAALANLASAVTVKKIGQTGTATREEIAALFGQQVHM